MLERKSFIGSIEPTPAGPVQIRIGLSTIIDGRTIETLWHRTVIEPGVDPDAQIAAVNADIAKLDTGPWPPVSFGAEAVKASCGALHTPAVVAAYKSSGKAAGSR